MLGKGLESLIPQKGNNGGGGNAQPGPQPSQPIRPQEPAGQPVQPQPPAQPQPSFVQPVQEQLAPEPVREPDPQPQPQTQPQAQPQPQPVAAPSPVRFPEARPQQQNNEEIVQSVFHLEVEKIKPNPDQPRRTFDENALRDLAHSIREFGFLQPLVVSKIEHETPNGIDVEYQLIAGERRLLAAKLLGLHMVPAIIRRVDLEREKLELAVIENIQRENLNPVETARAFQRLQEEFRMTQREIAAKLGKSREVVANTVRLLDLPEYIQIALQEGRLSESHARLLLGIDDPGAQRRLFDDILQNRLTTRDVKERVQNYMGGKRGRPVGSVAEEVHLPPELKAMQQTLSNEIGAPVEIKKNANTGKIMITFYSEEELENILRKLGELGER